MNHARTSVPRQLAVRAAEHPDRPFVTEADGRTATYGEFQDEVLRWAAAFRTLGLEAGDNVVTLVSPSISALAAWLGMSWLRVVDAACNTDYEGQMLTYLLNNARAKVVVASPQFVPRLATVAGAAPALETVVVIGEDPGIVDASFRVVTMAELFTGLDRAEGLEPPDVWDLSMMIYTSGTTGPSKGVLIPWAQVYEGTLGLIPADDLDATDCFYSPFPMFHASGRAALCLMVRPGGRFVIREQFSATHYWDDIKRHGCTLTGFVGAMSLFVWSQPEQPDDAENPLRRAVMFPVVPHFKEFERRFGLELSTCYAMTETGPTITSGFDITDPASCGVAREGYEIRIVDDHDFEVPIGEVGELIVRHRDPWTLCQGYFEMPQQTADAWRNGWFHTGDAFRMDGEGRYYFVDRIKDAIRRRGENISSFEVESLVNAHPGVAESAAIPVPSEWGEDEVKVCVVRSQPDLTEEQLVRDLITTMPRFMVPRYVEFLSELPKTAATLRVKKIELRANPLSERTWDRETAGVEVPKASAIGSAR